MKKLLPLLLLSSVVHADDGFLYWGKDKVVEKEIATQVLYLMDYRQTARLGDRKELNPLLGDHPREGRVTKHFATVMIGHALPTWLLPDHLKSPWQNSTLAVEAFVVGRNFYIGANLKL